MKNKHDFQTNEEDANTRIREEMQASIYHALKASKADEGILTNIDIARVIIESLGDDAYSVAGALIVLCQEGQAKFKKGVGITV